MQAYGAELILVSSAQGMEGARDLALKMETQGQGRVLDQFSNVDNPSAHYASTVQRSGVILRRGDTFCLLMGTTGTIMGVSRYLKEQNADVQIVGLQPKDGSQIPGIRRWPRLICPASSTESWSMKSLISISPMQNRPCGQWLKTKAFSVAFHREVQYSVHCNWRKKSSTQ